MGGGSGARGSAASLGRVSDAVRVRFAPSPTGFFHVGSAKAALYNWLVARQAGGAFVLRIEDTDAERNRPEWVEGIQSAMRWLGLDWDEGPYFQSQRAGAARRPPPSRLIGRRRGLRLRLHPRGRRRPHQGQRTGRATTASAATAASTPGRAGRCASARPTRAPPWCTTSSGATPTFDHAALEDFVVRRSDGSALFLLANVVDDIDMGITQVIRGEEHLPNTPKALLLWRALEGGPEPVCAHLPVLVNEQAPEAVQAPRPGGAGELPRPRASCPRRCATS